MKMISKATALLLAFMLTFSMTGSALGEDTNLNVDDYNGIVNQGVAFYEGILACADVYALTDYFQSMTEEEIKGYFTNLSEERLNEVFSHLDAIYSLMTPEELVQYAVYRGADINDLVYAPGVSYTKVATLAYGPVQVASKARSYALTRSSDATDNGIELSKKAETMENGKYKITLEAYTTGTVKSQDKVVPTDIVLVLDESGSMAFAISSKAVYNIDTTKIYYIRDDDQYYKVEYCDGNHSEYTHRAGWYLVDSEYHYSYNRYSPKTSKNDIWNTQFYEAVTRNDALESAAAAFVNSVHNDAITNNVDHRIAVVGFSGSSSIKQAFQNDLRNDTVYNSVSNAVTSLKTNGSTYINLGLDNAKSCFDKAPETANTDRQRVVVVFTDGYPGDGYWTSDDEENCATPAISIANDLKNKYRATVYTIGLLADADPTASISGSTNTAKMNRFLHYMSNNYPNATSMDNGGSGSNKGYYLAANDAESLKQIFKKISEEISTPTIDLGSDTIVKDIVSPYFQMPANASDITVKTAACTSYSGGEATWDTAETLVNPDISFGESDNSINVKGFNFTENFVSEKKKDDGTYGKKLIIEFTVSPKSGFLGGNNVPTNGTESGVYSGGACIETFTSPEVNVPIADITVTAPEKNVYLLGGVTEDQMKAGATADCGGVEIKLDQTADNFGLEGWQNAYVDINISTSNALSGMTKDGTYTVTCKIEPTSDGAAAVGTPATTKTGNGSGSVNVFKPEVTYQDSKVKYLVTIDNLPVYHEGTKDSTGANLVSVAWKHVKDKITKDSSSVTMVGTAPALSYTYAYSPNDLVMDGKVTSTQDVDVNVTFKINDVDVNEYTTTVRKACTLDGVECKHTDDSTSDLANSHDPEFVVHVYDVLTTLTITKTGMQDPLDDGQSFLFRVKGPNLPQEGLLIAIYENGSETISGLLVGGQYTVTEVESWSWRYTAQKANPITLEASGNEVTISNERDQIYWLDGDCYKENVFNTQGNVQGE